MNRLLIKNALLINEGKRFKADVLIEGERIKFCHCGLDPQSPDNQACLLVGIAGQARNDGLLKQPPHNHGNRVAINIRPPRGRRVEMI